ncbi:MAG: hypothetical protein ACP5NB_01655 [Chloroflexia bacterium]
MLAIRVIAITPAWFFVVLDPVVVPGIAIVVAGWVGVVAKDDLRHLLVPAFVIVKEFRATFIQIYMCSFSVNILNHGRGKHLDIGVNPVDVVINGGEIGVHFIPALRVPPIYIL